jgi:competence protein ComEA
MLRPCKVAFMLERYKHLIFGGIIVAIASGVIALITYHPAPTVITIIPPALTATPGPLQIYVTGAVNNPEKVYSLPPGSLVRDAINAAGGVTTDADLGQINLARTLKDGEQIAVPSRNASPAKIDPAGTSKPAFTEPVHINRASAEELQSLPGVGPAMAQKIIDYRTKNGRFRGMADLDNVPGIGPAKLTEWEGKVVFD